MLLAENAGAGTIIFNDFGPSNAYSSTTGWSFFQTSGPSGNATMANQFTPSGTYQLSQIDLALLFVSGTNAATVTLNSNTSGSPGAVLATWNLSGLPANQTCCTVQTLLPVSPLVLSSGTPYWIVVSEPFPNSIGYWAVNTTGVTGIAESNTGSGWFSCCSSLGAFDVQGNAVPEPATVTTGGLALLFIIVRKRLLRP